MGKQIVLDLPEKVKILGISGSPRKEGNTASMVGIVWSGQRRPGMPKRSTYLWLIINCIRVPGA